MPRTRGAAATPARTKPAKSYKHAEADSPMRPEIGTQAQFRKSKAPAKYRYDDSLSPSLEWDGQNPARERGEARIAEAQSALATAASKLKGPLNEKQSAEVRTSITAAQNALGELKGMSKPFLNWAGKAERLSFDVPTLPLFIHERLSTKAILETLKGHRRDKQTDMFELFGDPQHPIADQVLRAYEHRDQWVNRMILGDSLVVMNSLLHYEGLGGQVQMIYIDPPYGVKFGSNFQPFVRKRDVSHNDDEDMTREPEMVQAYRDTWELGLHSYLSYLRDRLLLARELLSPSGSVFVQISDENLHHVRELMDEVFGPERFIVTVAVKKKGSQKSSLMDPVNDYLLWYGKRPRTDGVLKFNPIFEKREIDAETLTEFRFVEMNGSPTQTVSEMHTPDGEVFDYRLSPKRLFQDYPAAKLFRPWPITNGGTRANQMDPIKFQGQTFQPPIGRCWSYRSRGVEQVVPMERLKLEDRLYASGKSLDGKRYLSDFPFKSISNWWDGLGGAADPIYVVQTNPEIVQRCLLMTTDPGDLVLDPTCGSGTTAYVAEQWGRRWITIDTSRVPLALARQRLLTATFNWYDLKDEARGPAAGFIYKRKQNSKGEEVGGIVPHITLKSIANNEPPEEEVLVDRPETVNGITRVSGAFCFEGTIPAAAVNQNQQQTQQQHQQQPQGPSANTRPQDDNTVGYAERMLEVLRKAPVLRMAGNKKIALKNIRPPARSLSLSAEAMVDATAAGRATLEEAVQEAEEKSGLALPLSQKTVAIVFGPENGAVSERLVFDAAREANAKNYSHLFVIGFTIEPNARQLIEKCADVIGIPATYVEATMDLQMGDLLKNMRSSQIFSVCGLPDVMLRKAGKSSAGEPLYAVELLGLDVFDPITMEVAHKQGDDVPAWFLDGNYNGLSFHVDQAFFPRTGAWENLKKALRGEYEDSVWEHLAGAKSTPFSIGDQGQIAVKVIDERGNELMVVKSAQEAKGS